MVNHCGVWHPSNHPCCASVAKPARLPLAHLAFAAPALTASFPTRPLRGLTEEFKARQRNLAIQGKVNMK
ncbi:hypothetical protein SLA2020_150450 [Shorea laevis]